MRPTKTAALATSSVTSKIRSGRCERANLARISTSTVCAKPGSNQPPADGVNSGFTANIVNQIFDLWVGPKLAKRGLTLTRANISKVLVEMDPEKPLRVLINDEAQQVADLIDELDRVMFRLPMREYLEFEAVWPLRDFPSFAADVARRYRDE